MTQTIIRPDYQLCVDAMRALMLPGCVYELRVPKTQRGTISGYFDTPEALAKAATDPNLRAPGIYVTINPCNQSLLARAANHVKQRATVTTSDSDISRRVWMPIDLDARRPADISSTDIEHTAAMDVAKEIYEFLLLLRCPPESLILADSGNGAHILVRTDLPNDAPSTQLVQRCLAALDFKFSNDLCQIDLTTYNPARIWKVYGTIAAKGDPTSERPHRPARLIKVPKTMTVAPLEALTRLAALVPQTRPETGGPRHGQAFDLDSFIATHGLEVKGPFPWNGGRKWVLAQCPWNQGHNHGEAYIVQLPGGAIAAGCHHNSCQGYGWHDLRRMYEPDHRPGGAQPAPGRIGGAGPHPAEVAEAAVFHLTDLGNAQRLVKLFGDRLHYCYESKSWLVWTGKVWEWDTGAKITALAKETVRNIYREAGEATDEKARKELAAHAVRSESESRIGAMITLAQSEPGIPIKVSELDTNPWLLNCLNGTIDLRTGQLLPHCKEDLLTVLLPTEYHKDAQAPLWMAFLDRVTNSVGELQAYLQRAVGYSLTGVTIAQVVFFLYGLGCNGKSTFMAILRKLLGEYAARVTTDVLMLKDRNAGGPKEGLANLRGKRFVVASELEDGQRLAVGLIKDMTGGETLKADRKYEHEIEYQPTHKLWLVGNHKPIITDTTLSIWRRMKLIPFTVTIPEKEIDPGLPSKLEAELPGILAWAGQGCLDWQRFGLMDPETVVSATQNYRHEQDILADFLQDCCVLEPEATATKKGLKDAYAKWWEANGTEPVSQRTFRNKLVEKGITEDRDWQKGRFWVGIRLRKKASQQDMTKKRHFISA